jgi:hypothetical protein
VSVDAPSAQVPKLSVHHCSSTAAIARLKMLFDRAREPG